MLGGNPAYTAPADMQFADNIKKVANSIHLGMDPNETAVVSKWHLPEAHYLESWGDAVAGGIATIQQPMIEPIFGGRTACGDCRLDLRQQGRQGSRHRQELLAGQLFRGEADAAKGDKPPTAREQMWKKSVHDGIVVGSKAAEPVKLTADAKKIAAAVAAEPKPAPAASRSVSSPARKPGTAASPTTAGCRKRPTR